jgi:hypothetical protein
LNTGPSPNAKNLPGAQELIAWYGVFPSFHDATVEELQLSGDGKGVLCVRGQRMTDKVDPSGYFILDKNFRVTFTMSGVSDIHLSEIMTGCIISTLDIVKKGDAFEFKIESSYGFHGTIRARNIHIHHEPLDHAH